MLFGRNLIVTLWPGLAVFAQPPQSSSDAALTAITSAVGRRLQAIKPGIQLALGIAPGQPPWHRYR